MSERNACVAQNVLSVILPVGEGKRDALVEHLVQVRSDWYRGQTTTTHRSPLQFIESLHFFRLVVIEPNIYLRRLRGSAKGDADAEAYGEYRPHLLLETWYDGDLAKHLDELLGSVPKGMVSMDDIIRDAFSYCDVARQLPNKAALRAFLLRENLQNDTSNTPFIGSRGRSAKRIREEQMLYLEIREEIDKRLATGNYNERDPEAIHSELRTHFVKTNAGGRERVQLKATNGGVKLYEPPPDLDGIARVINQTGLQEYVFSVLLFAVLMFVGLLALAGLLSMFFLVTGPDWAWPRTVSVALTILLFGLAGLVVLLALHERRDDQFKAVLRNPAMSVKNEEHVLQNPMTSSIPIKHGLFRLESLKLVLWFARWWATYMATDGRLAGISAIHMARWSIVTDPPMLLFTSNYNRSWESYLGEFVDDAADGLSAIWGHAQGFPRTRWLVTEGAHNEQKFKAYSRNAMLETQLWYSAYWDISMMEIQRNSRIRRGLFTEHLGADAAREWVELL